MYDFFFESSFGLGIDVVRVRFSRCAIVGWGLVGAVRNYWEFLCGCWVFESNFSMDVGICRREVLEVSGFVLKFC